MSESDITQALDRLWETAAEVMESLGDEFTYHQFLRALMDNQTSLLCQVKSEKDGDNLFE